MPTFLVDYPYRGGRYSIDLEADNWEQAQIHLQNLKARGKIEGQLEARFPAFLPVPLMTRLLDALCWWKNKKRLRPPLTPERE